GRITPVAEFDKVNLLGANVERASIHNYSLVKELRINIGAEVIVERANDVIPQIKEVTKEYDGYFSAPDKCPACGTKTHFVGEYLVCLHVQEYEPPVIGGLNKDVKEVGVLGGGAANITKLIHAAAGSDAQDIDALEDID